MLSKASYDDCFNEAAVADLAPLCTSKVQFGVVLRVSANAPAAAVAVPESVAVWHSAKPELECDLNGYGRIPAFWFTLNLPYNHLMEYLQSFKP